MREVADRVYEYYAANQGKLSEKARFHFWSRIWLWTGSKESRDALNELEDWFFSENRWQKLWLTDDAELKRNNLLDGARRHLFKKYPRLLAYERLAFAVMFARTVYGRDGLAQASGLKGIEKVTEYHGMLRGDVRGTALLSSYAVNYLLLSQVFWPEQVSERASLSYFLETARSAYLWSDPVELHLCLYLITHAILCDSLFYEHVIEKASSEHEQLFGLAEDLLNQYYNAVSMDIKFEMLVCARLCGYEPAVRDRIESEAKESLAEDGAYITDGLYIRKGMKDSMQHAEHRNVLAIMASMPRRQDGAARKITACNYSLT